MKKYFIITCICCMSYGMYGQKKHDKDSQKSIQTSTQKQKNMDLSQIKDETVKQAIEALQEGNKSWYEFFTENPVMTDDGNPVDFKSFFSNALGKEKFLTIDRVENNSKDIYGNFQAGKWGVFPVFFKFHKNKEGKFDRLDIGQGK